jgi:hAT family protein
LLTFYRFFQVYQEYGTYSSTQSEKITFENTEENSVTARLFKRRHIVRQDELQAYLSMSLAPEETDPLEWWKNYKHRYPRLACMARDYLAIPASSVPSEQCFSSSKNLITDNRNRLLGKTVRACMCLKSWWTGPLKNST